MFQTSAKKAEEGMKKLQIQQEIVEVEHQGKLLP